jgi:hypothetical protein
MDEARHMVATEVAMATGISVEEADERIGKAL